MYDDFIMNAIPVSNLLAHLNKRLKSAFMMEINPLPIVI